MQSTGEMWSTGNTDLFTNRDVTLLIELVEALPVLYAADKKSFKAIVPREKAWKIISEKLNRTGAYNFILVYICNCRILVHVCIMMRRLHRITYGSLVTVYTRTNSPSVLLCF